MCKALWGWTALVACMVLGGSARADEAVWALAGRQVLRVQAASGLSADKRIERLDERLTEILSKGGTLGADNIILRRAKGLVSVAVRDELLVTVTSEDAAANHTTKEKLGKIWLANLRKTLPLLAPKVNEKGA